MPSPAIGKPLLPELQNASAIERARFVARQRAAGMKMEQIGQLLGISAQRAGQILKTHEYDPEIQSLRDVGSAIRLHRKGTAALAELVDLGLSIARETSADPAIDGREKASIVAAAVQPAYRLVEGSEKVLKRHQIGAIKQANATFDHHSLLDAVAIAIKRIESLPTELQGPAREAMRHSIHGSKPDQPVIDVEAVAPHREAL
jgi:hypothetical protein